MDEHIIIRLIYPVIFSIVLISLGYRIRQSKKPLIVSANIAFIIFLIPVLTTLINYAPDALRLSSTGVVMKLFIFLALALMMRSLNGDFMFFNAPDELIVKSLEDTLTKHNVLFKEGPTKGLLSPGGKTKSRLIATLDLQEHRASVRFLINRKQKLGSVKFLNKKAVPDFHTLLTDLKNTIRAESVEPGYAPYYYFAIAAVVLLLPALGILK